MNSVSVPLDGHGVETRSRRTFDWRRWAREPLLHFALLGALIFAVAHLVEESKARSESSIGLDANLDQRLSALYRTQFGVPPSEAQLRIIVDDYIDDEVLYREALRLGLDQDDEIIRRRLIQKLEFLQRDSMASVEPATADLRAYYDAHPELFSAASKVSFTHVYFNPDRDGDAQAQGRARDARARLSAGAEASNDDAFPLEHEYTALTREQASRLFGDSDLVNALFTTPTHDWSEPLRSGFGWHLLRVTSADPGRLLPFEQVLPDVRGTWLHESTARARRSQLDGLRARYHVVAKDSAP